MAKKAKYSEGQKKAYYSGMGYAAAAAGKRIDFKSPERKESFKEGLKAGIEKAKRLPDRRNAANQSVKADK